MPTSEMLYERLLATVKEDSAVIGFILGGGRGKGITTEHSNYDIVLIVDEGIIEAARVKYKALIDEHFDLEIMSEQELMLHGVWGSDTMHLRYGYAHLTAVIDPTHRIQRWLSEQETIPAPALDDAIKESLDGYLNYTHRSLKNLRDLRGPAAHLAASDAVPLLITFLFAAEGRVRPYNEYIEWELAKHPLANLPLKPEEFSQKITAILASGDEKTQKEMLAIVRTIAAKSRVGQAVLDSWKDYYFG